MSTIKERVQITGKARVNLSTRLARQYERGASIRALAESTGPVLRLRVSRPERSRGDFARARGPTVDPLTPLNLDVRAVFTEAQRTAESTPT